MTKAVEAKGSGSAEANQVITSLCPAEKDQQEHEEYLSSEWDNMGHYAAVKHRSACFV